MEMAKARQLVCMRDCVDRPLTLFVTNGSENSGSAVPGSFRDFHETFLNELRRSRHRIRVDLDAGK